MHGFSLLKPKIVQVINWIYLSNELTHQEIIIREQSGFIKVFEMEKKRLQEFSNYENN